MTSADIAARMFHDGLARRRDLVAAGIDRGWIRRRVAAGAWAEPLPGVFDVADVSGTSLGRMRAALLFAGPDAYLSHHTAAAVHGLVPMPLPGEPLHITVPHGRTRRTHPQIVVHQDSQGSPFQWVGGVPISSPAATIIDLAGYLSLNDLRCLAADAVRLHLATVDEITLAKRPRRSGRRDLTMVIEELFAGAISGGEAAYWRAVHNSRLPDPELNVAVRIADGFRVLDGYWRKYQLGAEIDGRSVHAQAEAFDADRRRNNDVQLEAALLMHFSVADVFTRIGDVLTVTERFLAKQAQELGLPWPAPRLPRR